MTKRFAVLGAAAFAASIGYFVWWFVWPIWPEPELQSSPAWPQVARAVSWDTGIFTLFALHHSLFARSGLKDAVSRAVPPHAERAVYVWIASTFFFFVCWSWQPLPGIAWSSGRLWPLFLLVQAGSELMSVVTARQLGLLELSGIRQASRLPPPQLRLQTAALYGVVRHPIYFAWVLFVWAAPVMTTTRLLFAVVSTAYLVVAIKFEERDLVRAFGAPYTQYQHTLRWRLVPFVY